MKSSFTMCFATTVESLFMVCFKICGCLLTLFLIWVTPSPLPPQACDFSIIFNKSQGTLIEGLGTTLKVILFSPGSSETKFSETQVWLTMTHIHINDSCLPSYLFWFYRESQKLIMRLNNVIYEGAVPWSHILVHW